MASTVEKNFVKENHPTSGVIYTEIIRKHYCMSEGQHDWTLHRVDTREQVRTLGQDGAYFANVLLQKGPLALKDLKDLWPEGIQVPEFSFLDFFGRLLKLIEKEAHYHSRFEGIFKIFFGYGGWQANDGQVVEIRVGSLREINPDGTLKELNPDLEYKEVWITPNDTGGLTALLPEEHMATVTLRTHKETPDHE